MIEEERSGPQKSQDTKAKDTRQLRLVNSIKPIQKLLSADAFIA